MSCKMAQKPSGHKKRRLKSRLFFEHEYGLHALFPARNRGKACAHHFNQPKRLHQRDKLLDLRRTPRDLKHKTIDRRVDNIGAECLRQTQVSTRFSPLPATLISANSRSKASPSAVKSCTRCTGIKRSNCSLICNKTFGVATVTMVMRERCRSCSVSETVRLSMLNPRAEKSPTTRARTPGSLSTRTVNV